MFRISRAAIVFLCVGVIVMSVMSFRQEFGVVSVIRGTTNDQIAVWADAAYAQPEPVSARSVRDLLNACAVLKRYAPLLKAEPQLGETVGARCGAVADQIVANAPTNARARAVSLLMAPELRAADLAAAQQTAPYEPWPLSMRIAAIGAAGSLSPEVQVLARADFARALESQWGRVEMAQLYRQRVDLRGLIQGALEGLPPDAQAAFLRETRRSMTNTGGLL